MTDIDLSKIDHLDWILTHPFSNLMASLASSGVMPS